MKKFKNKKINPRSSFILKFLTIFICIVVSVVFSIYIKSLDVRADDQPLAVTSPTPAQTVHGSATIEGTGPANKRVQIKLNGSYVGTAVTDNNGNWTYQAGGLSYGQNSVSVSLLEGDAYSNAYSGERSYTEFQLNSGAITGGAEANLSNVTEIASHPALSHSFLISSSSGKIYMLNHSNDTVTEVWQVEENSYMGERLISNLEFSTDGSLFYTVVKYSHGEMALLTFDAHTGLPIETTAFSVSEGKQVIKIKLLVDQQTNEVYAISRWHSDSSPSQGASVFRYDSDLNSMQHNVEIDAEREIHFNDMLDASLVNQRLIVAFSFKITVLDVDTTQVVYEHRISNEEHHGYRAFTVDPNGEYVYFARYYEDGFDRGSQIYRMDVENLAIEEFLSLSGGGGPTNIVVDDANEYMYLLDTRYVTKINIQTQETTQSPYLTYSRPIGGGIYENTSLQIVDGYIYASGSVSYTYGETFVIDTSTMQVVEQIQHAFTGPVEYIPTLQKLYMGTGRNDVSVIDTTSHSVVNIITDRPSHRARMMLSADSTKLYTVGYDNSFDIQIFDTEDHSLVSTIDLNYNTAISPKFFTNASKSRLYLIVNDVGVSSRLITIDTNTDSIIADILIPKATAESNFTSNIAGVAPAGEDKVYLFLGYNATNTGYLIEIDPISSVVALESVVSNNVPSPYQSNSAKLILSNNEQKLYFYVGNNKLGVFDLQTNIIAGEIDLGEDRLLSGAALNTVDGHIYAVTSLPYPYKVLRIDSNIDEVITEINISDSPGGEISFSEEGTLLAAGKTVIDLENDLPFNTQYLSYAHLNPDATFVNSILDTNNTTVTHTPTIEFTLNPLPIEISNTHLANGTVGVSYGQAIEVAGGQWPLSFSVTEGELPEGITLNEDGQFVGVPVATGEYSFTVEVSDGYTTDVATFSIQVSEAYQNTPFVAITSPEDAAELEVGSNVIIGKGPRNQEIEILLNGDVIDAVTVNNDGDWTYNLVVPSPGSYTLDARWTPNGDIAFVPYGDINTMSSVIRVINTKTQETIKDIVLSDGTGSVSTTLNHTKTKLYAVGADLMGSRGIIWEIDINTMDIVQKSGENGVAIRIAVSPDDTIYVSFIDAVNDSIIIQRYDSSAGMEEIGEPIDIGAAPGLLGSFVLNNTGTKLYITDLAYFESTSDAYTSVVIDTATNAVTPLAWSNNESSTRFTVENGVGYAVVMNNGGCQALIIDIDTDSVTKTINVPDCQPTSGSIIAVDSTAQKLYMTTLDSLYVIDLQNETSALLTDLPEGYGHGYGASLTSDGTWLYMTGSVGFTEQLLLRIWDTQVNEWIDDGSGGLLPEGVAGYSLGEQFVSSMAPVSDQVSFSVVGEEETVDPETPGGPGGSQNPPAQPSLPDSAIPSVPPSIPGGSDSPGAEKQVPQNTEQNEAAVSRNEDESESDNGGGFTAPTYPGGQETAKSQDNFVARALDSVASFFNVSPVTIAQAFPWLLIMLLLILALVTALKVIQQLFVIAKTRKLVSRQALLNHEKKSLISLATHYLRTPLTILSSGIEMLPAESTALQAISGASAGLKTTIDELIGQIETNKDLFNLVEPSKPLHRRISLLQPAVFVPTLLTLGLVLGANILVAMATTFDPSWQHIGAQIVGVLIVGGLFYTAYDHHHQKKALQAYEQQLLKYEEGLDVTRNQFVKGMADKLVPAVVAVDSAVPGDLPEDTTKFLKEGLRQLEQTAANFILISQLEKQALQQRATNVGIRNAVSLAQQQLVQPNAQVAVSVPAHTIVRQPQFLLQKVLGSLIDNAVAHNNPDMPTEVTSRQGKSNTTVEVTDHGKGIAKEKLSLLFKPLSRVQTAEDFTHQGIGLSLYVNRLIMHYLDGDISASSKTGKGTTMRINMPNQMTA